MSKIPKIVFSAITIFVLGSFLLLFFSLNNQQIVYIDYPKVHDGFKMSKETTSIFRKLADQQKNQVDSLYTSLSAAQDVNIKSLIMQQIISVEDQIKKNQAEYMNSEIAKINQRIYDYGKDYAREKGYKYVLGSYGDFTVIPGDEELDVSDDFILYINKRYDGVK